MNSRRANRTFALALLLSIALHAGFLLVAPNPAATQPAPERRSKVAVRLVASMPPPASQPEEPKPEEQREIDLGLDEPLPPSNTWLGFADFLKQLADKSQTEQAAFTDSPIAAAPPPMPPVPSAPPTPTTPPVEPTSEARAANQPAAQANPAEAEAAQPEEQPEQTAAAPEATTAEQPEHQPGEHAEAIETKDETEPAAANVDDELALRDAPIAEAPIISENQPAAATPDPEPDPDPEPQPEPASQPEPEPDPEQLPQDQADAREAKPSPSTSAAADLIAALTALAKQAREANERLAQAQTLPPAPPPSEPQPAIARRPSEGGKNIGAQSDRESDPSSTVDVPREQWQLGRPLSAHGLEIKPRRPEVTILTSLTAWPRNPVCRISFDNTGAPKYAGLLQSTGDSRVDAAIEASLYRWRASGRELSTLRDDQTIDITMRLLINPERRDEGDSSRG